MNWQSLAEQTSSGETQYHKTPGSIFTPTVNHDFFKLSGNRQKDDYDCKPVSIKRNPSYDTKES